ncbi:MAG: histidine kinase [Actinomycetota bacterium]
MDAAPIVATVAAALVASAAALRSTLRARGTMGTATERTTYQVLHTAGEAALPLRLGLTVPTASKAVKPLRTLLGTAALALSDTAQVLAWDGAGDGHAQQIAALVPSVVASGRARVLRAADLPCDDADCGIKAGVIVPLTEADLVVGTLSVLDENTRAGMIRTTGEVARWVSTQLELAELDTSRARVAEADLRFLRAQISPHFIYNALTTIASFVRSDPERARGLLLDFAEFTRYSFRAHGAFTTLAEELRSIDKYLELERARFGDRLAVTLRIAPEVLPVAVPFLVLQPLVENAVRHGLESKQGRGCVTIVAEDSGSDCVISIEDDGVGTDPERLRAQLAGAPGENVGLANVDERLRTVFGPDYGLVVETALGAGLKAIVRVPKYRTGVRAS